MTDEHDLPPPRPQSPQPPPPSLTPPPPPPPIDAFLEKPVAAATEADALKLKVAAREDEGDDEPRAGLPAEINPRLLAGIIDILVMVGIQLVLTFVLPGFLDNLGWVAGVAYLLMRDSLPFLKTGSIGKSALKLQVVKDDGSPMLADWTTGAIRNAALLIPFFGVVEAIVLMNREKTSLKGRRLGDEWAKTRVVYAADLPKLEG